MNQPINLKTTLSVKNSISRSPLWRALWFSFLVLACFALSPTPEAFGVTPAPDGGYPNNNTAEGDSALNSLTTGSVNTAIGNSALFSNTTGTGNTATGSQALFTNTGDLNTATGWMALFSNTTGTNNVATGAGALGNNTTGAQNTATGCGALGGNNGGGNTATGAFALGGNNTGFANTATGLGALQANTTGNSNTATGWEALIANTTGAGNTATGVSALQNITKGSSNTADGFEALRNSHGNFNTATGFQALLNLTTGFSNIALGFQAGANLTTGSNNIEIGNTGVAAEDNTIRIGTKLFQKATFIAGISGATVAGGVGVIVDTKGHLGTVVSSGRFKEAIKPMDKTSEAILALKPVTFRYKKELDPEGIPQFGLVAEQVEKVNPDLVARDEKGQVYTVRYDAVNAMLLNEFLKEHRKVQEQETTISELKSNAVRQEATITQLRDEMGTVVTRLKEQDSKIQKVSDQLELSKPAPQTVADNQ